MRGDRGARSLSPVPAKQFTMPAEQGVGLNDQQRLPPRCHAVGEQHEERAVGRGAAGAGDATMQDEQLLAEEGVLGDKRGLAARQVAECPGDKVVGGWPRRGAKSIAEGTHDRTARGHEVPEQDGEHECAPRDAARIGGGEAENVIIPRCVS